MVLVSICTFHNITKLETDSISDEMVEQRCILNIQILQIEFQLFVYLLVFPASLLYCSLLVQCFVHIFVTTSHQHKITVNYIPAEHKQTVIFLKYSERLKF